MSMSTAAIDIIDHLQRDGIDRETAKELIDFVEKQRGEQATKQDLETFRQANKQDLEILRQANKQDLEMLRQATKKDLEPVDQKLEWLKWIVGIGFTIILAGMAALLAVMIYLHSDSKADVKELRTEMKELKSEVNQRFTKIEAEMKELKMGMKEIKELLQGKKEL